VSENDSLVHNGEWSANREKTVLQGQAHVGASGGIFIIFLKNIVNELVRTEFLETGLKIGRINYALPCKAVAFLNNSRLPTKPILTRMPF